jgi:ethanolamine utilization protein EutQ
LKKLISVREIKDAGTKGQKVILLEKGDIVTPSAKDAAVEFGVKIQYACETGDKKAEAKIKSACSQAGSDCKQQKVEADDDGIDIDMICRVVREMLTASGQLAPEKPAESTFVKERDAGGLLLVKADTVKCDPFDTGNPKEKVGMKDIVNIRESSNMGAGFMTIDHSDFAWNLNYEEFDYIVEGHLDITINGKTYKGKKGDVFFIPKDSNIVWSAPDLCKIFYVTYPANWAELAANK